MLRCAITDRTLLSQSGAEYEAENERRAALIQRAQLWAHEGIDLIQLREKDLLTPDATPALTDLARRMLAAIAIYPTRLLINSSLEAAIAARAHGLHLTSHPRLTPDEVRRRFIEARLPTPTITRACHTLSEIEAIKTSPRDNHPDAILFSPVFGKTLHGELIAPAAGLEALRAACLAAAPIPVLALGGITHENTGQCLSAGAAGIAGIRLFLP